MTARRVAACVVTGFLGSGKTTLLKGLLERDPARDRIAVIVNEIGEIGIDGRVLTGFEFVENVVEMASGCVCCSIDEYRFDLAIDEIVRRIDPALVVLETSGVADPAPTLERLRRCGLGVDAVVTVVDARAWQTAWRISATARRQIAAADFLVVSKSDLVSAATMARLRTRLAKLNARALVLQSDAAAAFSGSELLLATSAASVAASSATPASTRPRLSATATSAATSEAISPADRAPASAHRGIAPAGRRAGDFEVAGDHLRDEQMETFSWRTTSGVDRHAFESALRDMPSNVLRAKGFVRGPGDRTWLFQVVCGRVEMTAFEGGERMAAGVQGVFIGPGISAARDRVIRRLAACELPADSSAG